MPSTCRRARPGRQRHGHDNGPHLDGEAKLVDAITCVAEGKHLKVRQGLESVPRILVVDNELGV